MVKVLEAFGFVVVKHRLPICCGQAPYNAGFLSDARAIVRTFYRFYRENTYPIVVPSASCAAFLKYQVPEMWPSLGVCSDRVYSFSHFLYKYAAWDTCLFSCATQVVYHSSCAALREYSQETFVHFIFQQIQRLEVVPCPNGQRCCGFGGSFSVKMGPISAVMAEEKLQQIRSTGARTIVSTDMSCLLHLSTYAKAQGYPLQPLHIADLLAKSIA